MKRAGIEKFLWSCNYYMFYAEDGVLMMVSFDKFGILTACHLA